jgi:hypothetical protein
MTQAELEALKAQIKAELLQEMRNAPGVRIPRPWNKIRDDLLKDLESYDTIEQYQFTSAVSTIVRLALGVRNVLLMSERQAEIAASMAKEILEILKRYSVKAKAASTGTDA